MACAPLENVFILQARVSNISSRRRDMKTWKLQTEKIFEKH